MRNWDLGDYGIRIFLVGMIGFFAYGIWWLVGAVNSDDNQEQQFANEFYAHCTAQGGSYSSGYEGYVCWKNNSILFQTGSQSDHSVK